VGAVKQKGGAVTIKIQYFGEKSLESSMKSASKGGAAAPTSSAVDPPLVHGTSPSTFYTHDILHSWSPSPTGQSRIDWLHEAVEDSDSGGSRNF
jgi:hypothetical protein